MFDILRNYHSTGKTSHRLRHGDKASTSPHAIKALGCSIEKIITLMARRLFDIVGALMALVIFSPALLIILVLIKLESRGPVIYRQKRCGKDGKEFYMLKFRSMIVNAHEMQHKLKNEAEGSVFKVKNDPRITRVGKLLRRTSLDELPQIMNVLKGDMRLVGPRPLADEEMSADLDWRQKRIEVKPGVTGLWQISSRDSNKFDDWVRYDIEYVTNQSFLFDIKILFLTAWTVLTGKGSH